MNDINLKDLIILGDDEYLGKYRGADAEIIQIYNNSLYDVKTYDGSQFTVTRSQFQTYEEYYKTGIYKPKVCQCGASFTSFPGIHMFYCPMYKGE